LLVGEVKDVRSILGVLDRDCADVAAAIDVKLRILVQIPSLGDVPSLELDVERIGVTEILDLHGSNERSKKALCTVSPSASKITRRYLPVHLFDASPSADATVSLHHFPHRMLDCVLDPLQTNHRTIRARADRLEILGELHLIGRLDSGHAQAEFEPPMRGHEDRDDLATLGY
jgi:hypothetical protein